MQTIQRLLGVSLGLLALAACPLRAQTTAITYQGRLTDNGLPANGIYDLRFEVFDAAIGGDAVGGALTTATTAVTNGLFTVTLDFGGNVFTGADRWLEIGVRTYGSASTHDLLNPRQPVTAAPYAVQALSAGTAATATSASSVSAANVSGTLNATQIPNLDATKITSGIFTGNGGGLTNVNAAVLGGLGAGAFWQLGGNSGANPTNGAFLGTTDNQPLELKVNGARALRLEPNTNGAPNVIGGSSGNFVAPGVVGATISGGGVLLSSPDELHSRIQANYGTIAGGYGHNIGIDAIAASVGGGFYNLIYNNAEGATISGGFANTIGEGATYAHVGGGYGNTISTWAGAAFLGGGENNIISQGSIRAFLGGGILNEIGDAIESAVLVGGEGNHIYSGANFSFLGGGRNNTIQDYATASTLGGGEDNIIQTGATYSVIPGGFGNVVRASYCLAAGYRAQADHTGAFVWADASDFDFPSTVENQFYVRAVGGTTFVSAVDGGGTPTAGVTLEAGDGSWSSLSDRNAKENLAPASGRDVLEKVAALPLSTWNYKSQDKSIRHLGPMAQDFRAAFGLGTDERRIATVDADGVALAAIQGLNQKLTEELKRRDAENAELKQRLETLETLVKSTTTKSEGDAR